ncbi:hypothetical protein KCU92_g212, partial [Aureobasidium melanogenum]
MSLSAGQRLPAVASGCIDREPLEGGLWYDPAFGFQTITFLICDEIWTVEGCMGIPTAFLSGFHKGQTIFATFHPTFREVKDGDSSNA